MTSITPFLWFDDNLEEAIDLYSSIFPGAKVHGLNRMPDGKVLTADVELAGNRFRGLNGGPHLHVNEAISLGAAADTVEADAREADAIEPTPLKNV